jgi:flagella synthesis protein FlgN
MRATISFEEDARLVKQLLALLEREQNSLVHNKVSEIEKLIDLKASLLQQINLVAKNRYAALQERHFEANENGMLAWVVQQSNQVIKDNWDAFQLTLSKAKEMNRLNGDLITKHFNRNKQMLNNLRSTFQPNNMYGKNGQTNSNQNKRNALTA